ncbi:MAG TPA: PCYCGC motif-containing (lipo)protein, partial [Anaerolineae bacterium]|nr:PCYCGC motif-containing (lipo)protein [Anaerolineae bacterium]
CGCKDLLHTSNEDCYVKSVDSAGRITYDPHALNCQVCVDITQDVMRLTNEGQSPGAIKTYIDRNYSRFGPSNMN